VVNGSTARSQDFINRIITIKYFSLHGGNGPYDACSSQNPINPDVQLSYNRSWVVV
jgi:hypothetical protein